MLLEFHAKVEVVEDDGSTSVKEMTPEGLEMLCDYGLICGMVSSIITTLLFSGIIGLIGSIGWVLKIRRDEKMFEAFLPALKNIS